MEERRPILLWFRRDLRLADHPALAAAAETGRPIIPVFIRDASVDRLGAAPRWRLGEGLRCFGDALEKAGLRLVLRSGPAQTVLEDLVREVDAVGVYWSRIYDPEARERDTRIKASLRSGGLDAQSFPGHLLVEPWKIATSTGTPYRVFTPMWRALRQMPEAAPRPVPSRLAAPDSWPRSDVLSDWALGRDMVRGERVVARHERIGENAALSRMEEFAMSSLPGYSAGRDDLARDATSGMSAHLSLGEISPGTCWRLARRQDHLGEGGAEPFLRQLGWREFAYHLMYHTPHLLERNWRDEWVGFPWGDDPDTPEVRAWKRGRTGVPLVDAAMREMHVTGKMHNRGRMIAASYLTKHLLADWRIGLKWFEEHLVDWDPANNALGWQWVAGCGPDAAPYFRIFNPETQRKRFDPKGDYTRRWIAEGQVTPEPDALEFFDAVPVRWDLSPGADYPSPVVDLAEGRKRALAVWEAFRDGA